MNCMTNLQRGRRHRGDREAARLSCQVSQQSWDSSSSLMRQWAVLTFWYIRVQSSHRRFFLLPERSSDAAGYLHRASISAGEGGRKGGGNIRAFQCLISPAGGCCEHQRGASVLLIGFKVCSLFSRMQLKCSLISFFFFFCLHELNT